MKLQFTMTDGEYWWGGSTLDGEFMPFDQASVFESDYRVRCRNQGAPLLLSSKGRYVWSELPFLLRIQNGAFYLEGEAEITLSKAGDCLRDAYLAAMKAHFPFSGEVPPREFFMTAQYNTWMEFTYDQNQAGILDYARKIAKHGFKPGILIIDEGWHNPYGDWSFDRVKFPDPRAMVDELHALGFIVMLWVTPFVSPNGLKFIRATRSDFNPENYDKVFLRNEQGRVLLTEWWNGTSAILDFTNPVDCEYLDSQLRALMNDYGIDGFKFDGGTIGHYSNAAAVNGRARGTSASVAVERNIAWNEFGRRYRFHEYKDTYKGGGKPIIQRLADRGHRWDGDGICTILPNSLAQGLLGYPFICPDMIGGGEWTYSVMEGFEADHELFIRMAQVSTLFPMMQFSWAPWRVLDEEELEIVKNAASLHADMADEIYEIVKASAASGEPVLRNLEYAFPHCGYERILDEFMLGENILVCPVVTKGTFEKELVFPAGKWIDSDGNIYTEGKHLVKTPLERLAWFRRA